MLYAAKQGPELGRLWQTWAAHPADRVAAASVCASASRHMHSVTSENVSPAGSCLSAGALATPLAELILKVQATVNGDSPEHGSKLSSCQGSPASYTSRGLLAGPPVVKARLPEAKEMMTAELVSSWGVRETGKSPVTPA